MKVIYILGCSRCGSTVLDSILGSHADAVGLGEFEKLPSVGWSGHDYCGCGVKVRNCSFWNDVRHHWIDRDDGDIDEFESLSCRYRHLRQIPRILMASESRSRSFKRFASHTRQLFAAVSDVSGASVMIDSSKNPSRAAALLRMREIDVRLVHLVRDPRGMTASLARSWSRDPAGGIQSDLASRPAVQVAKEWNLAGRVADLLLRIWPAHAAMRVRYETLLSQPEETIRSIGHMADLDLGEVAVSMADGAPINVGHVVAGNRLRMQKSTTLRSSDDWAKTLSAQDKAQVERRCARRMRKYGYGVD